MPAIKSSAEIAAKWTRVTPQRQDDYKSGVQSPKKDWQASTLAAKDAYKAGIQAAITQDRFAKGVNKSSTDEWKRKAIAKGVTRFAEGVSLSSADYQSGFAPYRDVIENTTLPPRFAKGDPRNIERVKVMAAALHAKKLAG